MDDKTWVTIIAILCITILEAAAVIRGIDGALLAAVMAIIAGLAGYKIKSLVS